MKKSQKILWVLTIINTTIIFLFLGSIILSYVSPQPSYEEELREWITGENKKTIEYVDEMKEWCESEVQGLYDFGNKNWR